MLQDPQTLLCHRLRLRPARGFTLVEILAAMGILAVLVALIFPALSGAIERGRETKCLANHRDIISAVFSFATDNNGWLPGNMIDEGSGKAQFSAQKLSAYRHIPWLKTSAWGAAWSCPLREKGPNFPFSDYAFTMAFFGMGPGYNLLPVKLSVIASPSKSAAFACVTGNYVIFEANAYTGRNGDAGQLSDAHRGGTIITFMDGHSIVGEHFKQGDPRQKWFGLNLPDTP